MHTSQQTSRDPRLDFFRGLALVCIFIDHTPGNVLTSYTIGRVGFSDASELFVFISAYTAGLVYMRRWHEGIAAVARRAWTRAAQVYVTHLALLAVVTFITGWLGRTLRDRQFVRGMNVGPLLANPAEVAPDALALLFQPTFMNILPLYVVMLVGLPLMLWLIRRSVTLALLVSFALYVAARLGPEALTDNPFGQTWAFNPLAWQLLFVIGASLGAVSAGSGLRVPRSPAVIVLASVYAVGAFWFWSAAWDFDSRAVALPEALKAVLFPFMERPNLSLWRLGHVLALAAVVSYFLPAGSPVLTSRLARPLILCGRRSLTLFSVGVLLSLMGWAAFVKYGNALTVQVLVNAIAIAIMVGIAWLLDLRVRTRDAVPVSPEPG